MLPQEMFKFRGSEMPFPAFSRAQARHAWVLKRVPFLWGLTLQVLHPHYVMSQGCLFVYKSFLRGRHMFSILQDLRVHVAQWFKSANLMI